MNPRLPAGCGQRVSDNHEGPPVSRACTLLTGGLPSSGKPQKTQRHEGVCAFPDMIMGRSQRQKLVQPCRHHLRRTITHEFSDRRRKRGRNTESGYHDNAPSMRSSARTAQSMSSSLNPGRSQRPSRNAPLKTSAMRTLSIRMSAALLAVTAAQKDLLYHPLLSSCVFFMRISLSTS